MGNFRYHLHTTVLMCSEKDFKNAIRKLVLGFTFKKYSRKKKEYYQHNQHNAGVTRKLADDLYTKLLDLKDLGAYYATVDFEMEWTSTGRITRASDICVGVYKEVGRLTATELQILRTIEKVRIDIFFSDVDSASQNLLKTMAEIRKQYGEESFEIEEHKLLNDADYKRYADAYKVKLVPTIIINDKKFENPSEGALRSNIEAAINSYAKLHETKFKRIWK